MKREPSNCRREEEEHAAAAAQLVPAELARLGLTVALDKTQAWTADPQAPLPPGISALRVQTLKCLGNAAPWIDQQEDRVLVHTGADGAAAVSRAQAFTARLRDLRAAGLSAEAAYTLLCTYGQGCVTHHLRANLQTGWVEELENVLFVALETLLGEPLGGAQRLRATLRFPGGGCMSFYCPDRLRRLRR